MSRSRRGERGLTLVELLVAVVASAIVLLATTILLRYVVKAWLEGMGDIEMIQNARTTLLRISEDLQAAYPPVASGAFFVGKVGAVGAPIDAVGHEIHLHIPIHSSKEGQSATGTPPSGRSGDLSRRSIYLEQSSGETTIYYIPGVGDLADSQPNGKMPSDKQGGAPLAYFVNSMNAEYKDTTTGAWGPSWDSRSGPQAGRLPVLVRVKVVMEHPMNSKRKPQDRAYRTYSIVVRPGVSPGLTSFLGSGP